MKEPDENRRSVQIRNITGLSRTAFAKKYNIPLRTVEDWDWGKKEPSGWVMDLLERVVKMDFSDEGMDTGMDTAPIKTP